MSIVDKVKLGVGAAGLEALKMANDVRVKAQPIVTEPDIRLSEPCREVTDFSEDAQKKMAKMAHIMVKTLAAQKTGARLGLAANQCGYDIRVAIILGRFCINPKFNATRAPKNTMEEGCYSVPGRTFMVSRPPYGFIHYQNIDGEWIEEKLNGVAAVVAQHEIDHLNGILCSEIGEEKPKE